MALSGVPAAALTPRSLRSTSPGSAEVRPRLPRFTSWHASGQGGTRRLAGFSTARRPLSMPGRRDWRQPSPPRLALACYRRRPALQRLLAPLTRHHHQVDAFPPPRGSMPCARGSRPDGRLGLLTLSALALRSHHCRSIVTLEMLFIAVLTNGMRRVRLGMCRSAGTLRRPRMLKYATHFFLHMILHVKSMGVTGTAFRLTFVALLGLRYVVEIVRLTMEPDAYDLAWLRAVIIKFVLMRPPLVTVPIRAREFPPPRGPASNCCVDLAPLAMQVHLAGRQRRRRRRPNAGELTRRTSCTTRPRTRTTPRLRALRSFRRPGI